MSSQARQILSDLTGRRRLAVNILVGISACLLLIAVSVVITGNYIAPDLPQIDVTRNEHAPAMSARAIMPFGSGQKAAFGSRISRDIPVAAASAGRLAFYVGNVPGSLETLYQHAGDLDALLPDWLTLSASSHAPLSIEPSSTRVRDWLKTHAPELRIFPVLTGQPRDVTNILSSPIAQNRLISSISTYLSAQRDEGIALAFDRLPVAAHSAYTQFVAQLARALQPTGRKIIVVVGTTESRQWLQNMARWADYVLVRFHDQFLESSDGKGPPAGQAWIEKKLASHFSVIPSNKLIVGLASMAFSFQDAAHLDTMPIQRAWDLMGEVGASMAIEPSSLLPYFRYVEKTGLHRDVWLLDGVTMFNALRAAFAYQPAGFALWHLGTEDPTVWASFSKGRAPDETALARLSTLTPGQAQFDHQTSEILLTARQQRPGKRDLHYSASHGLIMHQTIIEIPMSQANIGMDTLSEKAVALTFDDGPDSQVTNRILDILASRNVKATFFVLGRNALRNPAALKRAFSEGHDIGNHTYSHTDPLTLSLREFEVELNTTQRILESELGIHTLLFRPPFNGASSFDNPGSAKLADNASHLGYLTVLGGVDSRDWMNPSAAVLHDTVVSKVAAGRGQIIVMHDFGKRDSTIEALPHIIDSLIQRGFRFVTIHELIGKSRVDIMPPAQRSDVINQATVDVRALALRGFSWMSRALPVIALIASALCILRLVFVIVSMLRHKRLERRRTHLNEWPKSVAMIIPAYNEESVICKTINSVLLADRENFEIIVVDDGSSDRTADVARETFAHDPRVRVFRKPNGGKAAAANFALARTEADVVVSIDADTVLAPDAIPLLVRHFSDPTVGAVAGTAVVGNRVNLLTRMQWLEYAIGQSIDRRALALYNANGIVPGAIGAWRRQALLSIGGYASDTLAEDADATFSVINAGWRVLYEPRAEARTEAPETWRGFLKQRYRWMFGMLQVLAKHRGQLFKGTGLGVLTIPNVAVFQFGFSLLIPVLDIVSIVSLAQSISEWWTAGNELGMTSGMATYAKLWLLFQAMDMLVSMISLKLGGMERPFKVIPLLIAQRVCYWPLIYWTALITMLAAAKGQVRGWNKLNRTGRVTAQDSQPAAG